MKRPKIACGYCDGTGTLLLPPELWDTFLSIPVNGYITATFVAEKLDINHTTALNRLEKLRGLGVVDRRPMTLRQWGWHRKPRGHE